MPLDFTVAIPARYGAARLPGKPLRRLAGRPVLEHVIDRARESGARQIIVATDDARIEQVARAYGAEVHPTSSDHRSGTERLAELAARMAWDDEHLIVNLQGDEPLMPPGFLSQVAEDLAAHADATVSTLATSITDTAAWRDPNQVKVVLDGAGYALYFSRAPIPWPRDDAGAAAPAGALRHLGLYAYRAGFLRAWPTLTPSPLEAIEQLEQLRVLANGLRMHVGRVTGAPPGVDTESDLLEVERLLRERPRKPG